MREILADLVAEQQGLDQSLQRAPDRDWKKPTGKGRWTVKDTIAYLAWTEHAAASVLTGARTVKQVLADYGGDLDGFIDAGLEEGRTKRPQEVIEWWRFGRADVVDALSRTRGEDRIDWIVGDVTARTFATARLADTWAHMLDIFHCLEKEIEDTPRLRHIAHLGWATLPYTFEQADRDYPEPIRVELVGPGYARWVYGPEESLQKVRGQAGDWCRLVVNRIGAAEAESLLVEGDLATDALEIASVFP